MKTEGEIRQKLKQVIFRHRKAFVQDGLERTPANCQHNAPARLPVLVSEVDTIRVCRFVSDNGEWNNQVCDPRHGGARQALKCPHFVCRNNAEDLKDTFRSNLGLDGSPVALAHIAREYPDVVALMWVLGPSDAATPAENSILDFFGEEDG